MTKIRWARGFACSILAMVLLGANVAAQGAVAPWNQEPIVPPNEATMQVGTSDLEVQLAVRPDQQQLGLGYRNGLAPGTGMLFVFDSAEVETFWMKGMRFCLDIVWVQDDAVLGVAENVCPDPDGMPDNERPTVSSGLPAQYVLEVPAGWMQEHGYGAGTMVTIPESDT